MQVLQEEDSINFSVKVVKALEDKLEVTELAKQATLKQFKSIPALVFLFKVNPDEKGLWAMRSIYIWDSVVILSTETTASMTKCKMNCLVDCPSHQRRHFHTLEIDEHDLNYKFSFEDLYIRR